PDPGPADDGVRATDTPLAATVSVPRALPVTDDFEFETALTLNGRSPTVVPALGVSASETLRELLAPGGTSIVVWPNVAATPGGKPAMSSANGSSTFPVFVNGIT